MPVQVVLDCVHTEAVVAQSPLCVDAQPAIEIADLVMSPTICKISEVKQHVPVKKVSKVAVSCLCVDIRDTNDTQSSFLLQIIR